jgi:hypothetical protein
MHAGYGALRDVETEGGSCWANELRLSRTV